MRKEEGGIDRKRESGREEKRESGGRKRGVERKGVRGRNGEGGGEGGRERGYCTDKAQALRLTTRPCLSARYEFRYIQFIHTIHVINLKETKNYFI